MNLHPHHKKLRRGSICCFTLNQTLVGKLYFDTHVTTPLRISVNMCMIPWAMEDFEILDLLPTGKQHVSYSEIAEWMDCSWRHKLKHVDKIDDGDRGSIHTEFGQVIHNGMELYFNNGRVPHTEEDIA